MNGQEYLDLLKARYSVRSFSALRVFLWVAAEYGAGE